MENSNIFAVDLPDCKTYEARFKKKAKPRIETRDTTTSLQTSHLPTHALSWIPCELWWVCVGAGGWIQHESSLQHTKNCGGTNLGKNIYWGSFLRWDGSSKENRLCMFVGAAGTSSHHCSFCSYK